MALLSVLASHSGIPPPLFLLFSFFPAAAASAAQASVLACDRSLTRSCRWFELIVSLGVEILDAS